MSYRKLTYEQAQEVRARKLAGTTNKALALEYGVTREAIGFIVRNHVYVVPGTEKYKSKTGVKGPVPRLGSRMFTRQRAGAKRRGIAWELTYKEWLDWWLATGHFHERGRFRGQYVMGRIGDVGPYALENIFCLLATKNVTQPPPRDMRGERNANAKLTWAQVREIRASKLSRRITAEQYKISPVTVQKIRQGKLWKEQSNG